MKTVDQASPGFHETPPRLQGYPDKPAAGRIISDPANIASMDDQQLLSELCSICHINTPKYRCPGCSTRTCSLQCVQRHKDWAQCSGKRDPTAYVKKSQLATPAGIDHDYNFITSIERSRDLAEEDLQNRGIQDDATASILSSTNFQSRLRMTRVIVDHAPVGMSRQKLNRTRWTRTRRILWTVEWINEDQSSFIGEFHDNIPISREYKPVSQKHVKKEDRKRKREGQPLGPTVSSGKVNQDPANNATNNEHHGSTTAITKQAALMTNPETSMSELASDTIGTFLPQPNSSKARFNSKDADMEKLPQGSPDDRGNHYYLVKPRTSGADKVLIPLSPTDSLLECLQDQVVLEFPTIQVLSQPPGSLPSGFVAEVDYLARFKKERDEMQRLVADVDEPNVEYDKVQVAEAKAIPNTQDILTILEQDMAG